MYKRAIKALNQEGDWESESSVSSSGASDSDENESDSSEGTDSHSDENVEALLTDLLEKDPELLAKISEIKKDFAPSPGSDTKEDSNFTAKKKLSKKTKVISFPCSLCPEKEIHTDVAYASHLTSKLHLRRSKKSEQKKDSKLPEASEPKPKAPRKYKKRKISDVHD